MPNVQGWNQTVSSTVKKYGIDTVSKISSLGKDAAKLGTAYMKRANIGIVGGVIVSNRKVSNALFHAAEKDVCISSFLFKHSEIIEQKLGNFSKYLGYLGSILSFVDDLSEGRSVANAALKVGTVSGEFSEEIGGAIGSMISGPVGAVVGIAIGYATNTAMSAFIDGYLNKKIDDFYY